MSAPFRFGPFYLDARIAVGGTAEVYLARPAVPDTGLPDRLVVKRLLPHFASENEGRTMFEREARLHAAVRDANVVTVFHAGVDEKGEPYLAMEYIDGVDGYRLLRRLRQEDELLPIGVSIYIARRVLAALESVHAARDSTSGGSLGIVHRDVSPSNIYLSKDGTVKLGDFGIARSTTRATLRSEVGHVLKGKFGYLAPEQVAGETADHRADLFSLATVLAEMFLNRPLFPGGGQLAVLLAIRDCRIDALVDIKSRLPPGLFEVMSRGLSRDPAKRYESATEFSAALSPFEADPRLATREIAARVKWVQSASSSDQLKAVRESVRNLRASRAANPPPDFAVSETPSSIPDAMDYDVEFEAKTERYEIVPSFVQKANGEKLGPWAFARLMEALATGQVQRGDKVDFVGRGFQLVEQIEELVRFFPVTTAITNQLVGPGSPDFLHHIGEVSLLQTLMRLFVNSESGVLFAERSDESGESGRKELYFTNGKLHHVASSNASELLGEYLVRRGKLERAELDLALAVLPRYSGRMGDTLISMGLVGPVDIFRAIREQGRDRVADLFLWNGGTVTFYRGQDAPHVEFPLELELPALMLAGLEAAKPGEAPLDEYRPKLHRTLVPVRETPDIAPLMAMTWPPTVEMVRAMLTQPRPLRDLLKATTAAGELSPGDVLRAVEILVAARLLSFA
ncbi:serine/threonine protein kinase [Labilithrix luteola]|uniref:Serine/threonine protein kinase n=1 Tax=Labilithrix luteola TaxID=1391654 RepID=A0A0K1QD32_9BACT|nr:serine/threonine-protein kinase [Labilithrix luteola]AKV03572.1 serine/threonine protein kinase [Labilithrix luteola]